MKFFLRAFLVIFMLTSDFTVFAQPGMDNPDGDLEGTTDPVPAPINGKLIILALAATLFVYFRFKQVKRA
ncbi:MAG: hypothetical protein CFE24_02390 [Flavobacterium sp. BFFFF2]|nr:MAG: hypothetical protein CFE24_02390 [Flavobacterium sp. BFFFF2]